MSNEAQIAWAAGLFEGEGSIGFRKVQKGRAPTTLRLGMTDFDAVEAFQQVFGVGRIRIERRTRPHQDLFYFEVSSFATIEYVLRQLRPWLKSRRGAAADEALTYIEQRKLPRIPALVLGGLCKHGHLLDEETLVIRQSKRSCRTCTIATQRRHRAKLKARAQA